MTLRLVSLELDVKLPTVFGTAPLRLGGLVVTICAALPTTVDAPARDIDVPAVAPPSVHAGVKVDTVIVTFVGVPAHTTARSLA